MEEEPTALAVRMPLYERLRSVLRDGIESDELRPGDAFPTETELINEHALSRITVGRAIAELHTGSSNGTIRCHARMERRWRPP